MRYEITGIKKDFVGDMYHTLMRTSWWKLMLLAFGLYVGSAIVFAILLNFGSGHVDGANTPLELFWFSVQTLSTVGYGNMHPASNWAHLLVLVESFVGLVETAIVTAVLFSKFSRPKARVEFAENAVLFESQGRLFLQIRFANARGYAIVNGKLHLSALVNQYDQHDQPIRRMINLPLLQSNIPFFGLSFTATHCLSDGVFAGKTMEEMHEELFLLIISFQGIDEILEQEVREQHFYRPEKILEHTRYNDMVVPHDWGAEMDLNKLDEVIAENILEIPDSVAQQSEFAETEHA
jgi:inward rectifier potassium channel